MGQSKKKTYTIAFYNIENLFDIKDNPNTNDNDYLPWSKKRWTKKRYNNKLLKIGNVISQIGDDDADYAPTIVGLAEVENKHVIKDLIRTDPLLNENYSFIHYDSSDERGVDVALLYKKRFFKVRHSETFAVMLEDEDGQRDYTRDILLVKGHLNEEPVSLLINHWSSRRGGENETAHKRLTAANRVNTIVSEIRLENPNEKIIVMGDFNDNPNDKSLIALESESKLFNPFKTIWSEDNGSLNHDFEWHLFDQILFSGNFFETEKSALKFENASIFDDRFLKQYHGRFKGQPFRTYVGKRYKGGYSDHFPVYIKLESA